MSLYISAVVVAPVCCSNNFDELAKLFNIFCLTSLPEHVFCKGVDVIHFATVGAQQYLYLLPR